MPGIGSLPMPASLVGYAISYTASSAGSPDEQFQRSVAIGTYPGSSDALGVLDWWYGNHTDVPGAAETHLYTTPAFQRIGEGGPVPEAHLVASSDQGAVVLVRTTGIEPSEEEQVRRSVDVAKPDDWLNLARAHGSSTRREAKVVAMSPDPSRSWRVTLEEQGPRNGPVLCLEISIASTGCLIVESSGPGVDDAIGAVASVKPSEEARKDEMFMFGVVAPGVTSVRAGSPNGIVTAASLVKASTGQDLFVAQLTKPGPLVQLEATGPNGTRQRTVPVDG